MENKHRGARIALSISFFGMLYSADLQQMMMEKLSSGKPSFGSESCTVPFELSGHAIIITAKVGERGKALAFVLDTGASTCVCDWAAKEIGLSPLMEIPSPPGSGKMFFTRLDSLAVGQMKVEDLIIAIVGDSFFRNTGSPVAGLIGSDFLRFFNVAIDYANRRITFYHDAPPSAGSGSESESTLGSLFPMRLPTVDLTINESIAIQCIVDTGSPFALVLPRQTLEKMDEQQKNSMIKSKGLMATWPFSTPRENYLFRIRSLKLGSLEVKNVPVLAADLPNQQSIALLGKKFLERYRVTLCYPKNKLKLDPIRPSLPETDFFSTGLALKKDEGDRLLVQGLWESSPADECGLEVGDEVLTLEGKPVSSYSLSQFKALLDDDRVERITITWTRNGHKKTATLQKRELLTITQK